VRDTSFLLSLLSRQLDDIIDRAGEPLGLRPVEQAVCALHTEVYENRGVDHGHLETTYSLTTNGGYVLGGTLVVTLRRGREIYMYTREREGKRGGRRERTEAGKEREGGRD
jgi:hypothetical protein